MITDDIWNILSIIANILADIPNIIAFLFSLLLMLINWLVAGIVGLLLFIGVMVDFVGALIYFLTGFLGAVFALNPYASILFSIAIVGANSKLAIQIYNRISDMELWGFKLPKLPE